MGTLLLNGVTMILTSFKYYAVFENNNNGEKLAVPIVYFNRIGEPLRRFNTNEVIAYIFVRGHNNKVELMGVYDTATYKGKSFIGLTIAPTCPIQESI